MSDTITKCDELGYFNDEWNEPIKRISNILTKNQVFLILELLYLHCDNKEELKEDFEDLKKHLKIKL